MIPLKDNLSCRVFPLATFILIALNCVAFVIELMVPAAQQQEFFNTWCVVPAKISHAFASGDPALIGMALLTVVTAMFMHGGWSHLIGNMIFLNAFGRSAEARMGSVWFTVTYLLGGFAAWGLHMFTDPTSTVPALGASGAIAFVLGAYLIFYPKADFKTLVIAGILPILAVVRAYWLLPVWFITQLVSGVGGLIEPSAGGGVAYWAHIGGFLFGLFVAGVWLLLRPQSDVCYEEMTCGCHCNCEGHQCDKHSGRRVRVLGFRDLLGPSRPPHPHQ
jgi:membrane associated rhomboid family serine protease